MLGTMLYFVHSKIALSDSPPEIDDRRESGESREPPKPRARTAASRRWARAAGSWGWRQSWRRRLGQPGWKPVGRRQRTRSDSWSRTSTRWRWRSSPASSELLGLKFQFKEGIRKLMLLIHTYRNMWKSSSQAGSVFNGSKNSMHCVKKTYNVP